MNHLTRIKNIPICILANRDFHMSGLLKRGLLLWLIKSTELPMRKKIQDSETNMGSGVRPGFKFNYLLICLHDHKQDSSFFELQHPHSKTDSNDQLIAHLYGFN